MKQPQIRRARGFVMAEMLLAVAVVGVIGTIGFLGYRALSTETTSDKQVQGVVNFIGKSKEIYGSAGNWTDFTSANFVKLNRIPPQFSTVTTAGSEAVVDANKNNLTLTAATNQGQVDITAANQEECSKVGQRIADLVYTLQTGPSGSLTTVKAANSTLSVSALATGCSGTNPIIRVVLR